MNTLCNKSHTKYDVQQGYILYFETIKSTLLKLTDDDEMKLHDDDEMKLKDDDEMKRTNKS